jgi:hypothetical protein
MARAAWRLGGLTALVGALVATSPGTALAQWRIYLLGKTQPIEASFYAEDAPWVFYRDDQSMYVFAMGCNRVERVERDGAPLPPPACPVDRLPTTMPRVYLAIMDLEAKRLDDNIAKLREQTRAYAQAVVGTFAATGEFSGDPFKRAEAELERRRNLDAVAFLQNQISDTLFEIRLAENRVGSLHDASKTYPRFARQRFFFFAK